jgi:CheY-like chemotaxis protein/HPt (histidine-containing phosphotransfer) domain-containing protein
LDTRETERHAGFQVELQRDFLKRAPHMLAALRHRVEPLLRAETPAAQVPELSELCRAAHSFAGHAGIAGFRESAQMSSALGALLGELLEKPKELTPSSLRTIVDACDSLAALCEPSTDSTPETAAAAVVLVVDDDAICRRAGRLALARLNVATIGVDDPRLALRLLAENPFSLIFLDVEMPGMNGFDLCKQLRMLPANQATPVVFVTSLAGFESRERASASGGNDLIAKPFLPMELAVKALSLLRRTYVSRQP